MNWDNKRNNVLMIKVEVEGMKLFITEYDWLTFHDSSLQKRLLDMYMYM